MPVNVDRPAMQDCNKNEMKELFGDTPNGVSGSAHTYQICSRRVAAKRIIFGLWMRVVERQGFYVLVGNGELSLLSNCGVVRSNNTYVYKIECGGQHRELNPSLPLHQQGWNIPISGPMKFGLWSRICVLQVYNNLFFGGNDDEERVSRII